LRKMNINLMYKWWWLLENEDGFWQEIVKLKYVKKTICLIQSKQIDSPIWSDLLKIMPIYLRGRSFKLNNGKLVSFWLDPWLDDKPLCTYYPILYDLCLNAKSSVYGVHNEGWVVPFKIILPPIIRDQWYTLAGKLN
jgi:hypothetical protein